VNPQVFHINKGRFRKYDLSNVTFVLIGLPEKSYGPPDFYRAFTTNPDLPVNELFATVFGLPLERGAEIVSRLTVNVGSKSHFVRIPGLLEYDVSESPSHQHLSPLVDGYLYSWLTNPQQWSVRHVSYIDESGRIAFENTNSLAGSFRVRSSGAAGIGYTRSGSDLAELAIFGARNQQNHSRCHKAAP
jgi:hypothetical protein